MNSTLSKLPAILFAGILLILAIFSCKKDPYEIGIALLPATDTLNIKSTDTSTVQAFSVRQDSIRTDKSGSLYLGSRMDPVFGKLTSSIYSQLRLVSEGVDFGTSPVLDSVVLRLFYNSTWGDTTTRQNLKIYEISQDFSYDSLHYSNQQLGTYPALLADQDFQPRPTHKVVVGKDTLAPHLSIRLSNAFGNKILNAPSSELATNVAFIKFMKGLYIQATPVSANGALLNFSITNGISKVVAYYHKANDTTKLSYDLQINESCARFTHLDHNGYLDANTDLKQQIINHDSAQGSRQLFLQGMAGVKIKVKFPFIKNYAIGKTIAVNEALLELKNYETNDTAYSPPPTLIMIRQDSAGRIGYLVDENEGSAYFGGTYNKTTRSYYFRITQHIQKVISNSYSSHFDVYIVVNNPITSVPTPNRIVLTGTNPLDAGAVANRLRLKLTYTILNKSK